MKKYEVIIPHNINPQPSAIEVSAAYIFANHYRTTVEFLKPRNGYKQMTPDFKAGGLPWEIKTPTGSSERTLRKHFRRALKQSANIIVDLRDIKLSSYVVASELYKLALEHKRIRKLIVITKNSQLQELFIHGKNLPKPLKEWYNSN